MDSWQENTKVGTFPLDRIYRHFRRKNMAKGRNLCLPLKAERSVPVPFSAKKHGNLRLGLKEKTGRTQGPAAGVTGFSDFHLLPTASQALLYLLHAMRKYHDQAWLLHHVISHMLVLTGHHHNSLLARDALGHVVLIKAPVHLSRL